MEEKVKDPEWSLAEPHVLWVSRLKNECSLVCPVWQFFGI
jgi:hypothetical protein